MRSDRAAEILIVTPTFYPEMIGTPHYVTDLTKALIDVGHQVRIVTNQPYYPAFRRFPGYGRRTRRDTFGGAEVIRLPTLVPYRGNVILRAVSESHFLLQVAVRVWTGRLSRSRHVLAVTPGVPFAVAAATLLRARYGRVVALVHDVQSGLIGSALLSRAAGRVETRVLDRVDHLAVLSEGMAHTLRRAGVTAPMSVDPLWPTIMDPGIEADGMTVSYSGNLGRKQGVHHLAELAKELAVHAPGARLVIRGDGSERHALIASVREAGLENVTFDGFVDDDELAASLARGAVHVVPQLPEGAAAAVPSKIFNILAVGRPVVAYAAHNSEVAALAAQTDAVVCVEPGDMDGFVREVVGLLEDEVRRTALGRDAKDYIARHRSRELAAQHLQKLLAVEPANILEHQ